MSDRTTPPFWRTAGLLFLAPVALAFAWVSTLGYHGLNGQDAHDYLHLAWRWAAWSAGDGPVPMMVEHPHGYPMAGALLGRFLGGELLALRLVSAASMVALALVVRSVLLRSAIPNKQPLVPYVLSAIVLSPFLLRYGMTVMSDIPAMALLMAAFLFTQRCIQEQDGRWAFVSLLFMALALSVRLAVAPLIMVLLAVLALRYAPGNKRFWIWTGALATGTGLALVLLLPEATWQALVHASPLADWSLHNWSSLDLVSDDGVFHYTYPNILYGLGLFVHPGFFPMGLFLIPFFRGRDLGTWTTGPAFAMVVIYLVFMAGMPFQNDRVLLLGQPFVVILFFPAFTRAWEWSARWVRPKWTVAVLCMAQVALFARAMLPFVHQAAVERDIADALRDRHAEQVFTHGMGAAMVTLCPDMRITELWYEELDLFPSGAFLVVLPENLYEQWEGRPPGINWEKARLQGTDKVWKNEEGWEIHRIR